MTNRTRTILAFLSGAAIAGIALVIVNVFFPELVSSQGYLDPAILAGFVVVFAGCHAASCTTTKISVLDWIALLGFIFASYLYLETTTDYFIFVIPVGVLNMILGFSVFRHRKATTIEAKKTTDVS